MNLSLGATLQITGDFRFFGDTINGPGSLHLSSGTFLWQGGNFTGMTDLVIDAGSVTVLTNGSGQGFFSCGVNFAGTFQLGGTMGLGGSSLVCLPGAQFTCVYPADIAGDGSVIQNSGTMIIPVGNPAGFTPPIDNLAGGIIRIAAPVALQRPLEVEGGTVTITPTGLVEGDIQLDGGALTGGSTGGVARVEGYLSNNSLGAGLSPGWPPGVISVDGNYTSSPNATLTINLGGKIPGSTYDQVNVGATASLNGSLNIHLANGFVPQPGDQFVVMTFGARTGTFPVFNGLNVGNGTLLIPQYTSTSLTLLATNDVPLVQPSLALSPPFAGSAPRLTWLSLPGQTYNLQWSPDLFHWYPRASILGTGSQISFLDTNPQPSPFVSYRLR